MLYIGCAGWAIGKQHTFHFPSTGTHLQRYAMRFNAVEINSSFYKPHREATYARWADSTPVDFRFAVKIPKVITHDHGLKYFTEDLNRFLLEIRGLGTKLGPILIQMPPRLAWDLDVANAFFSYLRERVAGPIVCEPRHVSWFEPSVGALFEIYKIARVIADPAIVNFSPERLISSTTYYFRLHGSPKIYYSHYDDDFLTQMAKRLTEVKARGINGWCIFDNTALGASIENALTLKSRLS